MGSGGGGGTTVESAPLWTKEQEASIKKFLNAVGPQVYSGSGLKAGPVYEGERYAGVDPSLLQMGQGALQNLSGNMQDVFDPIYQQTSNMWNQQIAPSVMERFAGMGTAASGGAMSALAREGQNLTTNLGATLAPMWLNTQMALPSLAQGYSSWEQGNRQMPLDIAQQKWGEGQAYNNPYLQLLQSAWPGKTGMAQENYASQSSPGFGSQLLMGMGNNLLTGGGLGNFMTGLTSGSGSVLNSSMATQLGGGLQSLIGGGLGALGGLGSGILSALGSLI